MANDKHYNDCGEWLMMNNVLKQITAKDNRHELLPRIAKDEYILDFIAYL